MSTPSNRVYSLWLVPGADTTVRRQLQATITELAAGHEDAPVFEPHVTVFAGIDEERTVLEETTQTFAAGTDPLELSFEGVSWSTTRHQCIFLVVEPTLELVELHRSARDTVDGRSAAFHPHFSLVYTVI